MSLGLVHGKKRLAMVMGREKTEPFFRSMGFHSLFHTEKYFEKHLNVFPFIQSCNGLVVLNEEDASIGFLGSVCVGAKSPGLTQKTCFSC